MDAASSILDRLGELGISVTVVEGNLRVWSASRLPEELREEMRRHKAELLERLHGDFPNYNLRYPGTPIPDLVEAEEIADMLEREGCVLMWSGALQAAIAVYLAESDQAKVPSGFTAYSQEELFKLWLGEAPPLSALRMVHEAKKYGGQVIESGEHPKERRKLKG